MTMKERNNKINRQYQDNVFCNLFSDPNRGIELINALCHTNYRPEELQNITLNYTFKNDRYNDLAFLTKDQQLIVLFEQQSTFDPNIPLRTLLYTVRSYEKWILGEYDNSPYNLHSRRKIPLPKPKIFVLYTGEEERPPVEVLSLFDDNEEDIVVQCRVTCYNLNKFEELTQLHCCKTLDGYQYLISTIKQFFKQEPDKRLAIQKAVDNCISHGKLVEYLTMRKSEVIDMLEHYYSFEEELKIVKEESYEDGFHDGFDNGFNNGFSNGFKIAKQVLKLFSKQYSMEDIARECNLSIEQVEAILE